MLEKNLNFIIVNKAHPNIEMRMRVFLGCPQFLVLIKELQENSRDKLRDGFTETVFYVLAELALLHNHTFPNLVPKKRLPSGISEKNQVFLRGVAGNQTIHTDYTV